MIEAKPSKPPGNPDHDDLAESLSEQEPAQVSNRRFVVERHRTNQRHYDLRLELDGVFKSWAVPQGPSLDPASKRLAVKVADYPLAANFESMIASGRHGSDGNEVWDHGSWRPENETGAAAALAEGDLRFVLDGKRLRGRWALVRLKRARKLGQSANWLFIKDNDEFAAREPTLAR